jgi:hypothetical protein
LFQVRKNNAADLSTIILPRSHSVGTHHVDEDVFVDQRASQLSRKDRTEHGIDPVVRINGRAAVPMAPSAMAATLNKSRRFMTTTISSKRETPGGIAHENRCVNSLVPALANAARCRPKSTRLKSRGNLFRLAVSIDENHGYSTRLERRNRARANAAAQYGLTIPQRVDKSGVTVIFGDTIARSASVFVTACINTGLDELDLPIPGVEDEKPAAASKVGGNVDSIVRWYSDLHVRFSLADTVQSKHPTASP